MAAKDTPLPVKLEEAKAQGALERDVAWIKKALAEGHLCGSEPRIESLEKGRNFSRGLAVTALFFALGIVVTVFVNCQQQTERDAETRALVHENSRSITRLEKAIDRVNGARAEDARRIISAVRENGDRDVEAGVLCTDLDTRQKRALRRVLGDEYPCE